MIHYFKVLILLSITFLNSNRTVGQGIVIESNSGSSYQMFLVPKEIDKSSKEYEKFASKIYLSDTFLSSEIDNFQDKVYLKYNIFKDEMEFINDNKVYYLKKNLGRKIHFFDLNIDFEIFNYKEQLTYFQILNKNKVLLLKKYNVDFQEEKKAVSSYQQDRPANFTRKDDVFFIKLNNEIIELTSNNKKFLNLLDSPDNKIKKFITENKLTIKKERDLLKIINYYNSL